MPGSSLLTKSVAFRVPVEVYAEALRLGKGDAVGYIKRMVIREVPRKHKRNI